MSENRHLWQGIDVSWTGEIIDLDAPPHGGGIAFTDYRCGTLVRLDSDAVPILYSPPRKENWGHAAVADFNVSGRLSFEGGDVVLKPKSLKQLSPWAIDDAFEAYQMKRYSTYVKMGLIKNPPE